ncbi:hypothetical protein ABZ553_42180, partial [Streptomyces sparsogenes]
MGTPLPPGAEPASEPVVAAPPPGPAGPEPSSRHLLLRNDLRGVEQIEVEGELILLGDQLHP